MDTFQHLEPATALAEALGIIDVCLFPPKVMRV